MNILLLSSQASSKIYDAKWLEFAIPLANNSENFLDIKNRYDGCNAFASDDENICTPEHFSLYNTTINCDDYIFDNTYFDETLSTKFNLVCDKKHYKSLLGTLYIVALFCGSIIGGRLG